ncbi:MAG TPA: STAS domain-containing protein [Azospira sp.]|nr:STAS domain-containing protein [Azospira sp.]
MHTRLEQENGKAIIKLSGRFDFNSHREFRGAYENALGNAQLRELVLDLAGVDYLDSSALGMLLLLREKAAAASKPVSLENCRGNVRQVLDIANFGKLFKIS